MASDLPALLTKAAHTQGRRAAPQSKAEGWPFSAQGGTNKAKSKTRGEEKETEGDKINDDNKEQGNGKEEDKKDSSVSSTEKQEMPMQPAAKTTPSSREQSSLEDSNEGREGMADDEKGDESFPCNVDVHGKKCKPSVHPHDLARAGTCGGAQQARMLEQQGTLAPAGR